MDIMNIIMMSIINRITECLAIFPRF
jgi:hypothetical protein